MSTYDETAVGTANPMGTGVAHQNQIVAMFDTYAQARDARDKLLASGLTVSEIDIIDRHAETTDSTVSYERNNEGFWGALKSFFVPEEDSHVYAEGLSRGHAMLVVRPAAAHRDQTISILESFNPIDFDARESEWKQAGWTGAYGGATAVGATSTANPVVMPPAMPAARMAGTANMAAAGLGDEKIEVLEENLRVGKREVSGGGIRVRSYLVERPIEESVTLREERVTLERHPVDRVVSASELGADAFRERTIAVTASSEEAVVAKDVRVVEEIGLRKDATERTETIKDTVRRTEVEVVDETTKLSGMSTGATKVGETTTATMPRNTTPL